MTMTATGAIRFSELNTEWGVASSTALNLGSERARITAKKFPSGAVSMSDLYSKFSYSMSAGALVNDTGFQEGSYGSLLPTSVSGSIVESINDRDNTTEMLFTMQGALPSTFIQGVWANNAVFTATAATFTTAGGALSIWTWGARTAGFVTGTSYKINIG